MSNETFLILFAVLTALNAAVLWFTRRNRKVIKEAKKEIAGDIEEASNVLDTIYGKLNEFMKGIQEIADKSKDKPNNQEGV